MVLVERAAGDGAGLERGGGPGPEKPGFERDRVGTDDGIESVRFVRVLP
ncbi:hypothetical protein [Streptomyces barringtoniae]|nr:hypothetical protein [Streptomyces barringtoniae]MCC5474715.1 hypothetical protein [Streptomyces barringtoniae]